MKRTDTASVEQLAVPPLPPPPPKPYTGTNHGGSAPDLQMTHCTFLPAFAAAYAISAADFEPPRTTNAVDVRRFEELGPAEVLVMDLYAAESFFAGDVVWNAGLAR
jgi:hypothetical protein